MRTTWVPLHSILVQCGSRYNTSNIVLDIVILTSTIDMWTIRMVLSLSCTLGSWCMSHVCCQLSHVCCHVINLLRKRLGSFSGLCCCRKWAFASSEMLNQSLNLTAKHAVLAMDTQGRCCPCETSAFLMWIMLRQWACTRCWLQLPGNSCLAQILLHDLVNHYEHHERTCQENQLQPGCYMLMDNAAGSEMSSVWCSEGKALNQIRSAYL